MRCLLADGQPLELARLALSNGNLRTEATRLGLVRSAVSSALARSERFTDARSKHHIETWEAWKRGHLVGLHLRLDEPEGERLDQRLDATRWAPQTGDGPGSLRHRMLDSGYASSALERYDRSAAACSVESRSPYMDRRVVEFFQSLPAEQLIAAGWTKSVLRRSMATRLPREVIWSRHKRHLGWSFTLEWFESDPLDYLRDISSDHALHEFVDVEGVLHDVLPEQARRVERCLPLVTLGLWLEGICGDDC
jgi:hypothetical protein